MINISTPEYWEQRYRHNDTGWDMNQVSPPLKAYIDQLDSKDLKVLIPGAGNAYEAEYLFSQGFKKVYVIDIAQSPLNNLKQRVPDFPESHLIHLDFFDLKQEFDLILEQTFFCALPPVKRADYAQKMHEILKPRGVVAGLFFDFPLTDQGPPFGGGKEEYLTYFRNLFEIKTLEPCYNSYPKRQGKELFFEFTKP
jgi:thiopurine S-methyltransferase